MLPQIETLLQYSADLKCCHKPHRLEWLWSSLLLMLPQLLLRSSLSLLHCRLHSGGNVDTLSRSEGASTPGPTGLALEPDEAAAAAAAATEAAPPPVAAVGVAGDLLMACDVAFRVGDLARTLRAGDLGFSDLGIGDGEDPPCLAAAALSLLGRGEVRLELLLAFGSTETALPRGLLLSGGTLSAKAAGADTEDQVDRAWSDPYPDSDLKLSDLSDLVSDRAPAIERDIVRQLSIERGLTKDFFT